MQSINVCLINFKVVIWLVQNLMYFFLFLRKCETIFAKLFQNKLNKEIETMETNANPVIPIKLCMAEDVGMVVEVVLNLITVVVVVLPAKVVLRMDVEAVVCSGKFELREEKLVNGFLSVGRMTTMTSIYDSNDGIPANKYNLNYEELQLYIQIININHHLLPQFVS